MILPLGHTDIHWLSCPTSTAGWGRAVLWVLVGLSRVLVPVEEGLEFIKGVKILCTLTQRRESFIKDTDYSTDFLDVYY